VPGHVSKCLLKGGRPCEQDRSLFEAGSCGRVSNTWRSPPFGKDGDAGDPEEQYGDGDVGGGGEGGQVQGEGSLPQVLQA
jgi:hypothetical protein